MITIWGGVGPGAESRSGGRFQSSWKYVVDNVVTWSLNGQASLCKLLVVANRKGGSPMATRSLARRGRYLLLAVTAVCALLLGVIPGASASTETADTGSSLWPTFSTPQLIYAVDVQALSATDMLTATTLQGVYNAQDRSSRLYLIQAPDDNTWLSQIPSDIHVQRLSSAGNVLQMLLTRFKPFIQGAVETNASNADTTNLATTMAGLDHAVVISPSQESLVSGLGIKVLHSFNTAEFTADNNVQTYQWGIQNLLPQSSKRVLVMLPGNVPNHIRDYAAATGAFMFYLTSTDATQKSVMNTIIAHTPANTPIMGYIPDEGPDVADLSSLGHFLNASDFLNNESVWAAMPSPAALHESTEPAPIKAFPNTVYVAFEVSDGDNAQYMQHRMAQLWQDPNMGAIPEGWTVAPGTVDFAPTLLSYYNKHLPKNSELVAGPSGIGYSTQMSGSDLANFAQLSSQAMSRDDIKTVDDWESLGNLTTYAQASKVPSISVNAPLAPEQIGDTTVMGQTSGYIPSAQQEFCTIVQQSAGEQAGQPLFLEPLVDGWNLDPTDLLHVAQQLTLAGKAAGVHYVFTTPTELALTMRHYYAGQEAGLPSANAQSLTGEQALAKPIVSPPYQSGPVTVTGSNLVTNPSGARRNGRLDHGRWRPQRQRQPERDHVPGRAGVAVDGHDHHRPGLDPLLSGRSKWPDLHILGGGRRLRPGVHRCMDRRRGPADHSGESHLVVPETHLDGDDPQRRPDRTDRSGTAAAGTGKRHRPGLRLHSERERRRIDLALLVVRPAICAGSYRRA